MTKRYTGGVISSSLPTVNAAGASGVFLLSQQADYQSRNSWPPFKVEKSLRFRNSASARLTRTPSVAGNKQIWTISFWLKTTKSNFDYYLFEASTDGGNNERTVLAFNSGKLQLRHIDGGSAVLEIETTQVFRDPSAWYHIVLAVDTTQATSSNRVKMYLNGSQITAFGTSSYPSQNLNTDWNGATAHAFGASTYPDSYSDGYFSEIYNIDGQALTPSSFGATDKDGNWSPIAYTGTYGSNGFYLNFKDNTSATTVGYDYSGNSNHWTLSGFNVSTANTSYDIMIDVPQDQSDGTANNRGNYCTLSPLVPNGGVTISEANLKVTHPAIGTNCPIFGTISMPAGSGKYYWECTILSTGGISNFNFGITIASKVKATWTLADHLAYNLTQSVFYQYGSNGGSITPFNGTANLVVGVAVDMSAGTMAIYANNVLKGTSTAVNTTLDHVPMVLTYDSDTYAANFGQRPFAYTPPSGFKALNTYNLPDPTIKQPNQYFDATTYTGTGSNTTITNAGSMEPGLVWIKARSAAAWHIWQDSLRGSGIIQFSNRSDYADQNKKGTQEVQFNSNGFSLIGSSPGVNDINESAATFVAWQWKSASSNTTNTTGSITTQVRANPTAGFSSFTFSGSASNGTIGHGLGAVPAMFIIKRRTNYGTTYDWYTYHKSIGNTKFLRLNTTGATTTFNLWQNTDPTSSVIYLTNDDGTNQSGQDYLGYAWAEIPGYSAFGSYTGNGSTDGPFVFTGFRPRFLMIKRTDSSNNWVIQDTSRDTYNVSEKDLYADTSGAEATYAAEKTDILSNGFKQRGTGVSMNASGGTYIYMAFAEMPFKYSRSR